MKILFAICLMSAVSVLSFAQATGTQPVPTLPGGQINLTNREKQERERRRKEQEEQVAQDLRNVTNTALAADNRTLSSIIKAERSAEQSQRLNPNAQDLAAYNLFLKSDKTGIFKLFPDLGCEANLVVNVGESCEKAIPYSWSYSFLRKDYGDKDFFDLRFKKGALVADGFLAQNILVSLGDVPLETVTLETKGMSFLINFKPETNQKGVQKQFWLLANKIAADGFSYTKTSIPAESTTYLMRAIAYRIESINTPQFQKIGPRSEDEKRLLYAGTDSTRRDKIIAFRIVRKDADGSLTILWRELSSKKSPKLEFAERKPAEGKR